MTKFIIKKLDCNVENINNKKYITVSKTDTYLPFLSIPILISKMV